MYSRVIIATDLSPASKKIVEHAKDLKALGTSEIVLLQCVSAMEAASAAYSESERRITALLESQEKVLAGYGFRTSSRVVFGTLHKEVNTIATEKDASLVVIGSKGSTLSKDVLLGGVVSEMIQHIERPTLVIRIDKTKADTETIGILPDRGAPFPESVLLPTDFSQNAAAAFDHVMKLATCGARRITLVHVQDMVKLEKSSKKEIEEYDRVDAIRLDGMKAAILAIDGSIDVSTVVCHGKPAIEILKVSDAMEPSLIVMGTQGRGFVNEILLGSVSHAVTRKAKSSILLVPNTHN